MPNWRDDYFAAIREADEAAAGNNLLLTACASLQDHVAALQAENALLQSSAPAAAVATATGRPPLGRAPDTDDDNSGNGNGSGNAGSSAAAPAAQLHADLAEALRSQGAFQSRLRAAEAELAALRSQTRTDARTIQALTAERIALLVKVRDRDEELRGKSKLVEEVQDELIALNLQLNIAEQQRDRIRKENKELVDRWMQRMGQEAEAMNLANEPLMAKKK